MDGPRFVIDTNQAAKIQRYEAPPDYHPILVISPLTWAEILNAPSDAAIKRIRAIAKYDVRFGMDLTPTYNSLVNLTEREIERFEPIHAVDSDAHAFYYFGLWNPDEPHWNRAKELKQQSVDHAATVEEFLKNTRKKNQLKKSRGEAVELVTFDGIDDAMQELFYKPDSPYRTGIMRIVTDDGKLRLKAKSPESFYEAMMKNPMLQRTFRVHAIVSLGYADTWRDKELNISVAPSRNDVTDNHLLLYARDGDTILTADNMLRRTIRHADTRNAVKVSTWAELLGIKE